MSACPPPTRTIAVATASSMLLSLNLMKGASMGKSAAISVREWGTGTESVIVLHGGPAAVGDLEPLARELGKQWHVLEPFQRGSGERPLTVATHVQDLNDLILDRRESRRPILIGHSWGAMLALAYAAEHPETSAALVLIGCGTFSAAARQEFEARLDARLGPADRDTLASLRQTQPNADRRLAAQGRIMVRAYGHDIEDVSNGPATIDAVAHQQSWADMKRLQNDGTYPAAFAAIGVPVLMLHGEADPHPGRMIMEDLRKHIPHLEYRELSKCGHSPWLERQAREPFLKELRSWVSARFFPGASHLSI